VRRNPELAVVLQGIADRGPSALLQGEVGQAIATKVQGHPSNPGSMTTQDLAGYRPVVREPLCFDYRATNATAPGREVRICGMPPPSSGAIAIGQILRMLDSTPPPPACHWPKGCPRRIGCTSTPKLRAWPLPIVAQYLGDPAFVQAPGGTWTSSAEPRLSAQPRCTDRQQPAWQEHANGSARPARGYPAELRPYAGPDRIRHIAHLGGGCLRQRRGHDHHD